MINEGEKRFLPLLSLILRPTPYCYFREIYARSENVLGEPAENIFLKLKDVFSKVKTLVTNPDKDAIFRSLLISQLMSPKKIYRPDLKGKIKTMGIINAPF
ncbi:MAG: hypothetical protein QXS74_08285 [Nitrososphaeria archaeon]